MNIKFACCSLVAALTWIGSPAFATGKDELWEISSKMEMAGMPFVMPAQASKICIPKGKEKDPNQALPGDRNCKMSDVKVSGNRMSWKMSCEGENPMSGSGEMIYGADTYSGKVKMHSRDGDMTMTYDGKRIGKCDAAEERRRMEEVALAPMKEASEKQRVECGKLLEEGGKALVGGYSQFIYPGTPCADMKKSMCDKVRVQSSDYAVYRELAASEKNAVEMRKQMGEKAPRALSVECGIDMGKAERAICQKAKDEGRYGFLAANCPGEAQALAKQHCEAWGRDYTSDHDNQYAPICARYSKNKSRYEVVTDDEAADEGNADSGSLIGKLFGSKPKDAAAEQKEEKTGAGDNPAGAVLDGAKKLKGLFGF
ncbi:MAG: DUF3617 family protein [Pseudomonadota bacterium]